MGDCISESNDPKKNVGLVAGKQFNKSFQYNAMAKKKKKKIIEKQG